MKLNLISFLPIAFIFLCSHLVAQEKTWEAVEDVVFLQEAGHKVETDKPVTSIVAAEDDCFLLMENVIYKFSADQLTKAEAAPEDAYELFTLKNRIWAGTKQGLYEYKNGRWEKTDDRLFQDMTLHLGDICAVTKDEIFRLEGDRFVSLKPAEGYLNSSITNTMEDGTQVFIDPVRLGPVSQVASYSGTIYMTERDQLILFDGRRINKDFIDWGDLSSARTNDLVTLGSRLFIGTDRGLKMLRGASLIDIKGKDGLPVEATTTLTGGFDNDLWIGTERGAVRMTKEDDFHYFSEGMWLPDQKVNSIAVANRTVYVATDRGLGIIEYKPMTLEQKADWMEEHLEQFGYTRLGFVHYLYKKDGEWIREITDNDGFHTAWYLAALAYKYAVTKDEKVREKAVDAFKSMVWLQTVTGTEGFLARAIWSPDDEDDRATGGSGGLPAKWYKTPDGKWFWKGDTSSDEVVSHFYAVSIFHDLAAEGEEKKVAAEHLARMASYIIECGWTMHDMDGKPTRWARWNPEYLLRSYGLMDQGLNGLEALSFMRSAYALTGDEKFEEGYEQLKKWGYPENTIRQKTTFPPTEIASWDDNLAFMSYYTLLRYEGDSELRSVYLRSLERSWEVKRLEHHPWFNFTYGALTQNEGEFKKAAGFLREWTLDGREQLYLNSHRDDLFIDDGYVSYDGTRKVLNPRERFVSMDGRNPFKLDGYTKGTYAHPPVDYMRSYWMGRYYGFIAPPKEEVPKAGHEHITEEGPKPYRGNPRPKIF